MDTSGEVKKITVDDSEDGFIFTTTIIYFEGTEPLNEKSVAKNRGSISSHATNRAAGRSANNSAIGMIIDGVL